MADKKIILVVDDSPTDLTVLSTILEKQYDVRVSLSAMAALGMLDTVKADMILLDIEMPGMSGFEFLHQIKKMPKLMLTPVIVVSCHSTQDFVSHALSQGANDLVPKPVNPDDLLSRIDECLAHPRRAGIFDL
jgi:CheY-like chemotaxis protein